MTKSRNLIAHRAPWSPEREQLMRDFYPNVTAAAIAQALGITTQQVYRKARTMGLQKSEAFLDSMQSGRVERGKQHPRLIATRFQPGIQAWNKGTHFVAGGRSAETRFKKGRAPQESRNYLPIGSLRLSKDGCLERKVTDDQSLYPARRWQSVHRLVWEAAHGPIPQGHMVVFRPGQFTNQVDLLTADRLECITRAQNAERNNLWRTDPDMMHLYQLKGAIRRQVNRMKETQHV